MNGINSINCRPQQTAKSLGFGSCTIDGDGNIIDRKTKAQDRLESPNDYPAPKPTFEQQVLANQQQMIGMLKDIKTYVKVKPSSGGDFYS